MSPGMTRNQKALYPDAVNVQHLAVMQKLLFIVYGDRRQLVQAIKHPAAHFSGKIPIFNFSYVQPCIFEKPRAVRLHCTDVIGVLMCDENVTYRRRLDAKPAHLFRKPVVIVARIDHDGRIALAVKENISHPLAHAGNIFINPSRVQRLEYLFAAVDHAHCPFLKFRSFFRHDDQPLFSCLCIACTLLTRQSKV